MGLSRVPGLGLASQVVLSLALCLSTWSLLLHVPFGLYSLKPASESSPEERRCSIAVVVSHVYCFSASGSKLNRLLANHKPESALKEIRDQAACLPVPDYLPINVKMAASRLFNSC